MIVTAASALYPPCVIRAEHMGHTLEIGAGSSEGFGLKSRDSIHPITVAARATHGAETAWEPMDLGVCGERTRSPRPTSETNGAVECNGRRPRRRLPSWALSSDAGGGSEGRLPVAKAQAALARLQSHLSHWLRRAKLRRGWGLIRPSGAGCHDTCCCAGHGGSGRGRLAHSASPYTDVSLMVPRSVDICVGEPPLARTNM